MGANISNQYVQTTINSLSSIVNSTTNSVFQNAQTTCSADANLTVMTGVYPSSISGSGPNQVITYSPCVPPAQIDGNVVVSQFASGSCNLDATIINSLNATYSSQLAQNIQNYIDQEAQQKNGFIAIALNIANTGNITSEQISQKIANSVSNNISQKCSVYITASATGAITICGVIKKDLIVNQKVLSTNITNCVTNNMVTVLTNDSILTDIVNKTLQKIKQDNEGLGDIFKYLIIGGIIIGVIAVIGVVLYLIFGNKNNMPTVDPEKLKLARIRALRENIAKQKARATVTKTVTSPVVAATTSPVVAVANVPATTTTTVKAAGKV